MNDGKKAGGVARAQALSSEKRKEIAQKAANARWHSGLRKAEFAGDLKVGEAVLACYVLEDGERVLSTRGVMKALGRSWRGRKYPGTELPVFLEAKNLKPFINNEMVAVLTPVEFVTDRGGRSEGFKAEALPVVCDVYLEARSKGKLTEAQERVAMACEILIRSFSKIGIIALVDEATGYQNYRARDALEKILDQFISEELRKWAKTFPDEFYREMFRLRGWDYDPASSGRPSVIGKYTNDLVYERLAPGILDELRRKNPKTQKGNRRTRHFQWLTEDVGDPRLREHLSAVIALMKASDSWDQFKMSINRALPKYGDTLELQI